ncbi:hypothetical protein GCM10022631_28210 [Deinococcus rubellus]
MFVGLFGGTQQPGVFGDQQGQVDVGLAVAVHQQAVKTAEGSGPGTVYICDQLFKGSKHRNSSYSF